MIEEITISAGSDFDIGRAFRMAVEEAKARQGVGKNLMRVVLAECRCTITESDDVYVLKFTAIYGV